MLKRHEADLERALDRLGLQGAISIPWDELYIWFNADRLTKSTYKEIIRRWEELCLDIWDYSKAPQLNVFKTNTHLLTIIRAPFEDEGEEIVPLESFH